MKILVTGSAGFVGYHLAHRMLAAGHEVTGFDGMTPYYDVRLKEQRHARLAAFETFRPVIGRLEDAGLVARTVLESEAEVVFHLAAQAGVRHSFEHPEEYVSANVVGTFNLLEALKTNRPRHLLLASTSSAYGGNEKLPFAERDRSASPLTMYAATKLASEHMSHVYAHLWQIPTTCFRFFTVYGPWGRPDMALFKFVEAIEEGRPIDVYGEGRPLRDYTYVEDLVGAVVALMERIPVAGQAIGHSDSISAVAPWRLVNIGGGRPVQLSTFIAAVEAAVGQPAEKRMLPMQDGDMLRTEADTSLLEALVGSLPTTSVEQGVTAFVAWYRQWREEGAKHR